MRVTPLDLGEHKPLSEVGPSRTDTGAREDGRGLSSVEQQHEALRWMVTQAERKGEPEYVVATIHWAHRPAPTRLQVQVGYETTPTRARIGTVRAVLEFDMEGKQIVRTARELVEEARAEAPKLRGRG